MRQAVLISIRPKWCSKIANGEKTIEVRKTRPKMETPLKCYIYCTKSAKEQFWIGPRYSYVDDHSHNQFDRCENGKVIGEFVCDWIDTITYDGGWLACTTNTAFHPGSCLSRTQLVDYIGSRGRAYGWRISNLKIYDKPLPLNTFKKWFRECAYSDLGFAIPDCEKCTDSGCFVQKPPQSWFFVEELK